MNFIPICFFICLLLNFWRIYFSLYFVCFFVLDSTTNLFFMVQLMQFVGIKRCFVGKNDIKMRSFELLNFLQFFVFFSNLR